MDTKSTHPFIKLSLLVNKFDSFIDKIGLSLETKKIKLYPSLSASVLFLAFSIFILLLMPNQININTEQTITARTFPTILIYIIVGGAVINIIKDIVKVIKKQKIKSIDICLYTEIKALILLSFLIIYAVLMPLIGFTPSSVIYAIMMLIYFRTKNWKYYLLVTILTVIIGLMFKNLLNVRLP